MQMQPQASQQPVVPRELLEMSHGAVTALEAHWLVRTLEYHCFQLTE